MPTKIISSKQEITEPIQQEDIDITISEADNQDYNSPRKDQIKPIFQIES
jgi:hypothetical protein